MGALNWSNALSTAGGATAQLGLEGVRATLDQQKIKLASDLAEQRTIGAEQRAPGVAAATTTATRDAEAGATVRNAPGLLNVETTRAKALNDEQTRAELERFKALAPVKRQEEIDTAVEKLRALSTPEMLTKERAIKLAGHIVDPVYALVPQADGTVIAVNSHDAKDTKVLKDADGKPIVRKDPEEMKAAVAVINMANTNLKIAEAAYKADASSLEPGVKEKATVAWNAAQAEAKQLTAPAYAVLYQKAKIPGVDDKEPAAPTGPATPKTQAELDALPPGAEFINPKDGKTYRKKGAAPAATVKAEPTIHLDPLAPSPNASFAEQRRAADEAKLRAEQAAAEEARQQRLRARAGDATTVGLMNTLGR